MERDGSTHRNKDKNDTASEAWKQQSFDLRSYFPFLVRIYYRAVSSSVERIYAPLFGLSVTEWRTMAILGPYRALSSSEIVKESSMDKVKVSRAIARLREKEFVKRDIDGDDRRRSVLRLTDRGREVYETLVPLVLEVEDSLLEGLNSSERELLVRLMEKVRTNAENLTLVGSPRIPEETI